MFQNMKIGTKLMGSFAVLLSIMAFLGAFALYQLNNLNDASTEITTNWLPTVKVVSEMNTNTSDFRIGEMSHILSTSEKDMQRFEKEIADVLATIEKNRAEYAKLISSPEEQRLYDDFAAKWGGTWQNTAS